MQFFLFLTLAVVLVVSQTTFLHFLPQWLGRPDFIYIFVAFLAYRMDWIRGTILTCITGWMLDVVAGVFVGAYVIEILVVFICLKLFAQNSPVRQTAYQIPLVGVSYFLMQCFDSFVYSFTLTENNFGWSWGEMLQETLVIVFAAIPCFLLLNSMYEYIESYRARTRVLRKGGNTFR